MFDIGFAELMVVGVLGLIILGPERLPKAARTVGLFIGRIRRTMTGIQQEIEQEVRNQEIREKLKDPLRTYLDDDQEQSDPQQVAEDQAKAKLNEQLKQQLNENVQAKTPVDNNMPSQADIDAQIKAMHAHHPQAEDAPKNESDSQPGATAQDK